MLTFDKDYAMSNSEIRRLHCLNGFSENNKARSDIMRVPTINRYGPYNLKILFQLSMTAKANGV